MHWTKFGAALHKQDRKYARALPANPDANDLLRDKLAAATRAELPTMGARISGNTLS